uniref:Uncharacterized protein n=1 Tax=Anguilla anguilla TaxID=7936 RepID=A0A0E9XGG3_ANGAN
MSNRKSVFNVSPNQWVQTNDLYFNWLKVQNPDVAHQLLIVGKWQHWSTKRGCFHVTGNWFSIPYSAKYHRFLNVFSLPL